MAFPEIQAALKQGQNEFNQLPQHERIEMIEVLAKEGCPEAHSDRYTVNVVIFHLFCSATFRLTIR